LNPIRPNILPPAIPGTSAQDAAKMAAARAFFAAAMGQGPAPATTAATVPVPATAPGTPASTAPGETPPKFLRPGSLIDIRV